MSRNQSLSTTRDAFETWYKANYGTDITTSAIDNPTKQPDFIMLNHEGRLEVIEIKRPQYSLTDKEYERAFGYLTAVSRFVEQNEQVYKLFHNVQLTIVCDALKLSDVHADALTNNYRIVNKTWTDLLQSTLRVHEDFLAVVKSLQGAVSSLSVEE